MESNYKQQTPPDPVESDSSEAIFESLRNELTERSIPAPVPVVQRRKGGVHKRLFVILTIVVLAAAGTALYVLTGGKKVITPPKTGISQASGKKQTRPVATTNVASLIADAQNIVPTSTASTEFLAPDYTVEGYDFYASARKEDTKGMVVKQSETTLAQTVKDLEAFLAKKGFAKSEQQLKTAYYPLTKYENKDTFCGINYYTDTIETLKTLYLSCALKISYAPTAQLQEPFYDTYRAANKGSQYLTDDSRLGYPSIRESKTAGYKVAEAAIYGEASPTGAKGLFYLPPDGSWTFFKGTQQGLLCKDYATIDQKKAFTGEPCYLENGTESTVKP